ncbi:fimbrial protein [Pinirhizobacter soli]|uniref:fimbrial protein n=1 Tax=Pinirhizobacter soli TaxID=2786953 RepID=UPI00202AA8F3|nr:fimbrial protein [Pinirhizobacter soli]
MRNMILACMLLLAPLASHAACSYSDSDAIATTAPLQGSVTVGRDVPVGTEIYRARMTSSALVRVLCDAVSPYRYRFIVLPNARSPYVHPVFGANVYQTNVQGVGVVVWAGNNVAVPAQFNSAPAGAVAIVNNHNYFVSLVKTAEVVLAGSIPASQLPTFEYVVGTNNLRVHSGRTVGSLNIVSATCRTPDVNVNLGNHVLDVLTGVNTTTTAVDVSIALQNCPAFFGRTSVTSTNGTISAGSLGDNTISYLINPTTSAVDAARGILALSNLTGSATGIGIQLLRADGITPAVLNSNTASGLALQPTNGQNYQIQLKARYIQIAAVTTPGQANAAATVTLTYL